MVNGALHFRPGARNFRFEGGYAGFQFGHGQRRQILLDKPGQKIIALAGEVVVHVHAGQC